MSRQNGRETSADSRFPLVLCPVKSHYVPWPPSLADPGVAAEREVDHGTDGQAGGTRQGARALRRRARAVSPGEPRRGEVVAAALRARRTGTVDGPGAAPRIRP